MIIECAKFHGRFELSVRACVWMKEEETEQRA